MPGAKVATLANATGAFDATAGVHPAMWASADAENLKAPIGVFPSKDENEEEFEKFMEIANKKPFASKNKYKRYPTQIHGWAAARADLSDPENLKQYEDVYTELSHFFKNALA
ncbi:hypothetical protein M407DRAFT_214861 [Tulasnella calospora MUT 4182]|uniref:Dienelactone hydrolase domain-containing protein n=1 Tax=Tulasnella calospora MUT 4182 TaxID=1051891 RepID=A0A0C3QCV2_9AGAM|nr:hypothetical protein M407DRAFT_214861 [Tulasnella calospora MUT 4182]